MQSEIIVRCIFHPLSVNLSYEVAISIDLLFFDVNFLKAKFEFSNFSIFYVLLLLHHDQFFIIFQKFHSSHYKLSSFKQVSDEHPDFHHAKSFKTFNWNFFFSGTWKIMTVFWQKSFLNCVAKICFDILCEL